MNGKWILAFIIATSMAGAAEPPSPPEPAAPAWLQVGAEIRGRAERLTGIGYTPDWSDSYYLHRLRLNAKVKVSPDARLVVQVQDSQVLGYSRSPVPATVGNTLDLRQAYVEAGVEEGDGWTARAGRQPLVFGDMRLVSTSNWGNVGPAYDAARVSYKKAGARLDGFASSLVAPRSGRFDRPGGDRHLHGFYSSFDRILPRSMVEAYLFLKDNRAGHLKVYTYGTHVFGKLQHGMDYNLEMAVQTGHAATSSMRAWAGHWETGYSPRAALRFLLEYNYASGDHSPADGKVETFDNLYPTDKYGTADGIAWRNIHEPILGVEWKLARKWKMKNCYHAFWLADRNDALYAIAGAVLARNPNATSSRVGEEIDTRLIYQYSSRVQLFGGYGYFASGPYLKQSTRGSSIHYPYIMWTYAF